MTTPPSALPAPHSQCDAILAWLTAGHTLTPLEALTRFKCLRLGARIHELQARGIRIEHTFVKLPFSGKRVMSYSMPKPSEL